MADYFSRVGRDIWSLICGHFGWDQHPDAVLRETSGLYCASRAGRRAVILFVAPRLRAGIFDRLACPHYFDSAQPSFFKVAGRLGAPWQCGFMRRTFELANDAAIFSFALLLDQLNICYATVEQIVASNVPGTESAFPRLESIEHKMVALCADADVMFQGESSGFGCHMPQVLCEQKLQTALSIMDYWKRQAERCQSDLDAAQERIKRSRLEFEETTAALETLKNARAKIDSF